jgi:hypothetical protein
LVWALLLPILTQLDSSDAAGNGMAQGFAFLHMMLLWALLAALFLLAALGGNMPWTVSLPAVALIPGSGFAAFVALELLSHPSEPPYLWPIVVPAIVPPAIVALCLWALFPPLHRLVPPRAADVAVWGAVLALCLAEAPMSSWRSAHLEQRAADQAAWEDALAAVPPNAPLWRWTPFLDRGTYYSDKVLERIRHLDRKQADAETMLARGDFPLLYLGRLDLDATPSLCDKARAELRRQVAPLLLKTPQSRPYADVAAKGDAAATAMEWLVGYDCACNDEALAWETMANGYRDTNYDIVRFRELRDPARLGRTLREYPAKFSMLTPKAHLKAWLSFAGDKVHGNEALAGARKLDRRTADAAGMLNDKYAGPGIWELVAYIPDLDLEATPDLCTGALRYVRERFAQTYRPKPDDPRTYDELLSRLGAGDPLRALQWLAGHGCAADPELADAESLVRSYRDSPARAEMLASLAKLHSNAAPRP